jgi:ABC-type Fe3+/spermidine/putrescine transport system ATPase subunit
MRELILTLQRESAITTVVVTHDQEEAVILADRIALLFNGELQQFAEPRAFYDQPASERVARFFGGVNFLRGMKAGDTVTTPAGVLQVDAALGPDGPVTLTVRPEALRFAEAESVNVLEARIIGRVYAGTHARFKFESHGISLEMVTDAARYVQHTEGETVRVYLPPERLWALR